MVELSINGKKHTLDIDPNMPILWVLRDVVGLKGTKFGCGKGLCGACTVHLNGQAIRSCSVPASAGVGAQITTIEGLSPNGTHPLQVAWREHNVPQCGYCQCGQIMNAASLLQANANPTDQEIVDSMSGNLCRCGTYPRIKAAIKSAAKAPAKGAKAP